MKTSRFNIEILKSFSEIIAQTINEIESFQIPILNDYGDNAQMDIGKDILVIHAIGSKMDCSMKDVIVATGLPNSTATRRVGHLVENNLVIRRTSKKDKRKTILKLTKNGKKSFSLFFDYFSQKFHDSLQVLNDDEKKAVIKFFNKTLGNREDRTFISAIS